MRSYNSVLVLFLIVALLLIPSLEGSSSSSSSIVTNEADAIVEAYEHGDMPVWLSDYIHWHISIRHNKKLLEKEKILIVEKVKGGLSDKIRDLPYFLWLAAKHQRLLLIEDWGFRCKMTEFLGPNLIDWTMESSTTKKLRKKAVLLNGPEDDRYDYLHHLIGDDDFESHKDEQVVSIRSNYQSFTKSNQIVFEESKQNRKIFKYIFHTIFRLTKPVQTMLEQTKKDLGLHGEYLAFHLRLAYPGTSKILKQTGKDDLKGFQNITDEKAKEMLRIGENAVRCVRSTYQETTGGANSNDISTIPIYGASDTLFALEALKAQSPNNDSTIKFIPPDVNGGGTRLHSASQTNTCSEFYNVLVDLWILGGAKCTAFGHGGYGSLSLLLGDFDCWTMHQFNSVIFQLPMNYPHFINQRTNQLPDCLDYENDPDIPESQHQKHLREKL